MLLTACLKKLSKPPNVTQDSCGLHMIWHHDCVGSSQGFETQPCWAVVSACHTTVVYGTVLNISSNSTVCKFTIIQYLPVDLNRNVLYRVATYNYSIFRCKMHVCMHIYCITQYHQSTIVLSSLNCCWKARRHRVLIIKLLLSGCFWQDWWKWQSVWEWGCYRHGKKL